MRDFGSDRPLLDAARATVAYADLFDFPLEPREVHRDLIGIAAAEAATTATIETLLACGDLAADGAYLVLPGRGGLARVRAERQARAARLWPSARRLGRLLGQFPFVRTVALSGPLAAGNPDARADIDFLIITAPGRLWTARAMAVALVRLARHGGVHLCPNYLLSTRALALDHRDLFTAHELLQATPLSGADVYRRLLDSNPWAAHWLPNRYRQRQETALALPGGSWFQTVGEGLLAGRLGGRLERWEGRRKQQHFRGQCLPSGTGRFTADLAQFGRHAAGLLRPGGRLLVHMLSPWSVWDILPLLGHRGFHAIAYRLRQRQCTVIIGGVVVVHRLYSPREAVRRLSGGGMRFVHREAFGILTPPPGCGGVPPFLAAGLGRLERRVGGWYPLRNGGRFFLLELEKPAFALTVHSPPARSKPGAS